MLVSLFAATILASVEECDFSHAFKAGQVERYHTRVIGDPDTAPIEIDVKWSLTVGEVAEELTKVTIKSEDYQFIVDGGSMPTAEFSAPFQMDKHGLIREPIFDEQTAALTFNMFAMYLPAQKLEEGASYEIDWKSEGYTFTGKGRFAGWREADGKKTARLQYDAELSPFMGELAYISGTIYYDPELKLVTEGEVSLEISGQFFDATVKRITADR